MLISKDSPLRRVPTNVEPRTVLFLDGIRYSIEILDLNYQRLEQTIERINLLDDESDELSQCIVEAVSYAWLTVDSAHRLRELVQQLPGLRQRDPNVQLFLRNTLKAEELRHFVQHFRSGIDSFVAKRMPLWGALSWSRIDDESKLAESHTIVPGTFYRRIRVVGCVFDFQEFKFVDRIVLHAGDVRCDLAEIYDRVEQFSKWFEEWFSDNIKGAPHHGSDVHLKFAISDVEPGGHPSELDKDELEA